MMANLQRTVAGLRARAQSARPNILQRLQSMRGSSGGVLGTARARVQGLFNTRPNLLGAAKAKMANTMSPPVGLTTTRFESTAPNGGFRGTPAESTPTEGGTGYRSIQ